MRKTVVKVKKPKLKGVDKEQKQKLEEMIGMLFSSSSRNIPIHELVAKYVNYKNNFKSVMIKLLSINNITSDYEPGIKQLMDLYLIEYKKYFSLNHNNILQGVESPDEFYANYEAFKASDFIQWVTRIAHKIYQSGIIGKKGVTDKTFREVCIGCQSSSIVLNIFTNVVNGVDINYDYSKAFHEGIQIPKDKKIVLLDNIRDLYLIGKKIYKLTIQPELPIDELFTELMKSLGKYRAKIRNADKLFNLLSRKSDLFKNNFTKYYKKMIQFNSPLELFTNFFQDVISEPDVQDPTLLLQCKNLMAELNKSMSMPHIRQNENYGKVKPIMEFITQYIYQYQDLANKPQPVDVEESINQYKSKFVDI